MVFCPLRGPNYQLMRNFLFAASLAERDGKSHFGVLTIGPRHFAPKLNRQVELFRNDVLQEVFFDRIAFIDYESYADVLASVGSNKTVGLADFLRERIRDVIGG
jgi:hypothetical protein